ncbi:type IV pili methyl-accepting chemotaxis transducer N-terminal domain-containing protein [Reichenbachiella carrageenanivorans]|uniref:Type IV pili methyl-accepting chemotaxis transducer N-terminal domain-containing protein n=1 Tax=Reichenbachiella carrageenanivorans TaxID=2979869 RepID=A0ABY6CZ28_9BACT|nr:type IV pili methyl-accepting chemotaxis transducer N-terminal domain-containing protein [Reichenbachiella carrageenanivorans]UXX79118.1 type IV pili methyl-accepting chemotaxis transducer N-terminal domain-containing protein [Reichenbachiella carrageenanivorans]
MKKLTIQYLLFLGVLTLAIVSSQILIQRTISDSKTDSRIINVSGRQRMLSQKITKAALKLPLSKSNEEFNRTKNELKDAARLWTDSHQALQYGNAELDVSEMNESVFLQRLFIQIKPYFVSINEAADELDKISFNQLADPVFHAAMSASIQSITDHEKDFLKLMNDIVFEYDRIASEKVEKLSASEYYLLAGTILLILLEAFFIFRPMVKTSKRKDSVISEFNDYVQQSISALGQTHQEKEVAEGVIAQAHEKIEALTTVNNNLRKRLKQSKTEYEKKLSEEIVNYTEISELNNTYENRIKNLERELKRINKSV